MAYHTFNASWFHKARCMSLYWRHNDHDGASNHQPHGCLLNRLFRRKSKKTSKLRVTGLCVGNSPGPVNSPHKGPVTRKMFPFDDVIMYLEHPSLFRSGRFHSNWYKMVRIADFYTIIFGSYLWICFMHSRSGIARHFHWGIIAVLTMRSMKTFPNIWFCSSPSVNSLWPSHTIWRHRSQSNLAQVIAYKKESSLWNTAVQSTWYKKYIRVKKKNNREEKYQEKLG